MCKDLDAWAVCQAEHANIQILYVDTLSREPSRPPLCSHGPNTHAAADVSVFSVSLCFRFTTV